MRFNGTEEQMEILREIADNISDPVFLVDRSQNVWYFNRAFETVVGVRMNSKRYRDRPCRELLGLSICDNSCVMQQAITAGQTTRLAEIRGKVVGGEERNFQITALPVLTMAGKPFGALIFLKDVTAETRIQEKYKELVTRNSSISLSGQIEQGNLIDVIQLFAFLQKSGELLVKSGDAEGSIIFESGKMVSILLGSVINAKALGRMLAWLSGSFSFRPEVSREISTRITQNSDFMLMDAVREKDEIKARAADLPALDTHIVTIRPLPEGDEALEEVHQRLFAACQADQPLSAIVDSLPDPDSRILLALLTLRDKRVVGW